MNPKIRQLMKKPVASVHARILIFLRCCQGGAPAKSIRPSKVITGNLGMAILFFMTTITATP
jgi:hypothetical protein